MVVDVIRRLFSRGIGSAVEEEDYTGIGPGGILGGVPQGPELNFDTIIAGIKMAQDEVDRIKFSVLQEIQELRSEALKALKAGDRDTAETIAAEIVMRKKLLNGVIVYSKMLKMLESKLKTTRSLQGVLKLMELVDTYAREIGMYAEDAGAQWAASLFHVRDIIERVTRNNEIAINSMPSKLDIVENDGEVRKELAEIVKEAMKEGENLVGSIEEIPMTVDYEELEVKLIDYIKAHNGVVKLKEAARELGVSPKVIKNTLYRLARKGLIKVSKSGGQAEATPA